METDSANNKRIAYNTIILYVKLILSVIIGLYTSRLILLALGASDYGLYTVVGGIVSLLNIIGITMVSTSYRYISVEMGKGEKGNPNKVYNTILVIHIGLALLFILLGLIVGFWYIDNYLNVEQGKLIDAKYVMIVSMITTAFTILSVPSNGLIIAREKFLFTSFVEIIQAILRLFLIFFILRPFGGNKLMLYANMMAFVTIIAPLSYTIYCYAKEYQISRWRINKNLKDYYEVLSFTGWLLISAISFMGVRQGAAMIMNFFFGTVVNAAFGISMQVQKYLMMFPKNITQAANPQIMKSFGDGNQERSLNIVYNITRYSCFVFLLPSVPCLLFVDEILKLWLSEVPKDTNIFVSLMILDAIILSLGAGFDAMIQASGKIRINQIGYSIINFMLLPIIYILYVLGFPPYTYAIVMIAINIATIAFQSYVMTIVSNFSLKCYSHDTLLPVIVVFLSILPMFFFRNFLQDLSFLWLCMLILISVLWTIVSIYLLGLGQEERVLVRKSVKKIISHNNRL